MARMTRTEIVTECQDLRSKWKYTKPEQLPMEDAWRLLNMIEHLAHHLEISKLEMLLNSNRVPELR